MRRLRGAMVAHLGYAPVLASSGAEAVANLGASLVVAAIIEMHMSDMDGPATLAALRALEPGLPCVLISGHAGAYPVADLMARGAGAVLAKPVTLLGFGCALATAISLRRPESPP